MRKKKVILLISILILCMGTAYFSATKKHEIKIDNIAINDIFVSNCKIYLLGADKPIIEAGYSSNPKPYSYRLKIVDNNAFITVCTSNISLENDNAPNPTHKNKDKVMPADVKLPFSNFSFVIKGYFDDIENVYLKDTEKTLLIWHQKRGEL